MRKSHSFPLSVLALALIGALTAACTSSQDVSGTMSGGSERIGAYGNGGQDRDGHNWSTDPLTRNSNPYTTP